MKTISLLLLVAFWMNSSPLRAQNQNQPKPQQAQPWAPEQEVLPVPNSLEADPHFKHLSPEGQHWVKSLMDSLDKATERHDIAAIDQLTLEVARKEVTGMRFCGAHIFNEGMFLDAIEFVQSKEHAFVARWLEAERGSSVVHTALFTEGRCIATDGSTLDGRSISKTCQTPWPSALDTAWSPTKRCIWVVRAKAQAPPSKSTAACLSRTASSLISIPARLPRQADR